MCFNLAKSNQNDFSEIENLNVNYQEKFLQNTCLHYATLLNNAPLITFLLKKGANPNIRNYNNLVPLSYALANKNSAMVQLLLNNGACENGTLLPCPENNKLLVEQEALDIITSCGHALKNINLKYRLNNCTGTLLHYAAQKKYHRLAKALLERNQHDIYLLDQNGKSPLWYAAHNGYIAMTKNLLNKKSKSHITYYCINATLQSMKNYAGMVIDRSKINTIITLLQLENTSILQENLRHLPKEQSPFVDISFIFE